MPTRWNPSDGPTRDVVQDMAQLEDWEENDLYRFSELPNMKKIGIDAGQTGLRLLGPIYLFMSVFRQSAVSRNVS